MISGVGRRNAPFRMIEAWASWLEKVPASVGKLGEHRLPTGT